MKELTASVEKHYSRGPTFEAIVENLKRKEIDLERVRAEDLYPYDQSHAGGIAATRKLAQRANIQPNMCVVDIGCGSGGAARCLHAELSCEVVGIDLTTERLRTALALNRLIGAASRIQLIAAQAQALPLRSGFADVLWTQHLTMNLPDHAGFLRECARVLKPSGRLACHEWFLNSPSALPFPLPWASSPSLNHAIPANEFLQIIREQKFAAEVEDVTAAMLDPLRADVQAVTRSDPSSQRIPALRNLIQAASDGLLCCRMITASRLLR